MTTWPAEDAAIDRARRHCGPDVQARCLSDRQQAARAEQLTEQDRDIVHHWATVLSALDRLSPFAAREIARAKRLRAAADGDALDQLRDSAEAKRLEAEALRSRDEEPPL